MKVTVEEQKPTPPPKKVVIELDWDGASMLCSLTMDGVAWHSSGEFGAFADELHTSLQRSGVRESKWETDVPCPVWKPSR